MASIEAGQFRRDLYFRLRGVELKVPPLRDRREDVLLLARYFLERFQPPERSLPRLAPRTVDGLLAHSWPGNVRELEHVMRAAAVLTSGDLVQPGDLGLTGSAASQEEAFGFESLCDLPLTEAKNRLVEEFERRAIRAALEKHGGNISAAARQLGIHRQNLQQKLTALGIDAR